jgi:cyclase
MSLSVRVIPCLDVKDGRVVKGIKFKGLQDIGDPVQFAKEYYLAGADEITFLDVSATLEGREAMLDIVEKTAKSIFIPLTVGGGISKLEHVASYLQAGADKVSIGSSAISNPALISEIAERYGDQIVVVSLDVTRDKSFNSGYSLTTHGGSKTTGIDAVQWILDNGQRGIGEILLNSVDTDGTQGGFDLDLIKAIRACTSLPIIASGGAGNIADFYPAVASGANAVLAATIFHSKQIAVYEVKFALADKGVKVRIEDNV